MCKMNLKTTQRIFAAVLFILILLPSVDFAEKKDSSQPQIIKSVAPVYPEIARVAGVEGEVVLKFVLNQEGKVDTGSINIIKNTTGESGCKEAAIVALKQYRFSPAKKNGKAISVWAQQQFTFKLNRPSNN